MQTVCPIVSCPGGPLPHCCRARVWAKACLPAADAASSCFAALGPYRVPPYKSPPVFVGHPQINPNGTSSVAELPWYQSSGSNPVSSPCLPRSGGGAARGGPRYRDACRLERRGMHAAIVGRRSKPFRGRVVARNWLAGWLAGCPGWLAASLPAQRLAALAGWLAAGGWLLVAGWLQAAAALTS